MTYEMQPRSHEATKKTSVGFRVFVFSWLPLVLIAAGEIPFDSLALSLSKGELAQGRQTASSDYVGAQACASCHKQVHETGTAGRHGKTLQPATATVKGKWNKSCVGLLALVRIGQGRLEARALLRQITRDDPDFERVQEKLEKLVVR